MNRNRHIILTFLITIVLSTIYSPSAVRAQYVKVNIDRKTVQAMTAAFAASALVEEMYLKQNKTIFDNYSQAEIAAAVIFASKMLDRKALTTLGVWTDPTENYYYRRIYNLVGRKLMPKIWTVSSLMLRRPGQALYWGSYLCKICSEIQNLCYQFESVVTNSTLSFSDITFLSISPELQQLFDPQQLGGIDWNVAIDRLFEFLGEYSQGSLLGDIEALYQKASSITSLTTETLTDELLSASSFKEYASQGIFELIEVIDHYFQVYESLEHEISYILKAKTGNFHDPSALFSLAAYNLKDWVSDYLTKAENMQYTQQWYIVRKGSSEEELYSQYFPPLDQNSIKSSAEWYRIPTTNYSYQPSETELARIRENSERYSGYSQKKIDQMNQEQSQSSPSGSSSYHYSINYRLYNYSVYEDGNHSAKAFAYNINVYRQRVGEEIVFSDVYDSSREPIETFKSRLLQRMRSLERQYPNDTFEMVADQPNYYAATDEKKIQGVETVIISASCSDKVDLASGVNQYKCKDCGSSVNAHTRGCAMSTSVGSSSSNAESNQLQSIADEYQTQLDQLRQELLVLEAQEDQIIQQMDATDPNDEDVLKRLRDQYSENFNAQVEKRKKITEINKKIEEVNAAQQELDQDCAEEDDYTRIPSIMENLRSSFSVQWNQNGHWSGNTYIVTGKIGSLKNVVTLRVNVSIQRGPKYFLGIKIHRAIVKLDWALTGAYSDSQIVDIIELDNTMTDSEKAQLVNLHIAQASQDFAGCSIVTEYVQSEPIQSDSTDDSYHLLWASDRLDIARMVETRLTNIYSNLVCMEKFMNSNLTIVDVIRAVAPSVYDAYQRAERTQTICSESLERWREAARGQSRRNNAPKKTEKKE